MKIGLANVKTTWPYGVAEDVQVKVKNLTFLADFVILEMEYYCFTPILLGRPFLATTRAIIDVDKQEIVIRSAREFEIFRFPSMSSGKMKLRGDGRRF